MIGNESMKANPSDLDHLRWLEIAKLNSFRGLRILDLGCGSGYVCHKAMEEGAQQAVGVDIVKPQIPNEGASRWQFSDADLNDRHWQKEFSNPFNLVLAFDILEHLDSPYLFLKSCRELTDKNGKLVLTTPNTLSWERFYKPNGWSGIRDPQHKTLFTKYSLDFLLRKAGFSSATFQAPMRSLSFLGPLQPQIGGQILCIASP
jgi:2-polyprenyl-3-methyl-5-hydroxy-6-metoxy-1,4-benzoquinol methylase